MSPRLNSSLVNFAKTLLAVNKKKKETKSVIVKLKPEQDSVVCLAGPLSCARPLWQTVDPGQQIPKNRSIRAHSQDPIFILQAVSW